MLAVFLPRFCDA